MARREEWEIKRDIRVAKAMLFVSIVIGGVAIVLMLMGY